MKKRILHNKLNFVGVTNALALLGLGGILLLGTLLVNPSLTISHTDAHAMSGTGNGAHADSLSTTLSTKTTASLASMLSIALSDSIDIDITPQSKGALGLGKARLAVTTNNTTGYSIYLSTVDGSNSLKAIDQENQYVDSETGEKEDTTYAITAMNGTTEYSKYLDNEDNLNTWGYALTKSSGESADTTIPSDTKFTGLKDTAGDSIYYTKSTTSNDTYDLNIAVVVDASLPAGGYRNGIVVSAVANPIKISGFNSIYYMQEMTSDICASAQEHEEGQLVDKRDNKIYWVGKLKDGNSWMTQNLDLDLSTDVALTPEDTNVTEEWYPPVATTKGEVFQINDPSNYDQRPLESYDPGSYVAINPSIGTNCKTASKSAYCSNMLDVTQDYLPIFKGSTEEQAVDFINKTYDAHYLVGNYYQFNTAVAGAATSSTPSKAQYDTDICPQGWKLPLGSTNIPSDTNGKDSIEFYESTGWYRLLSAYGLRQGPFTNTSSGNYISEPLSGSSQKINAQPLYLVNASIIAPLSYAIDGQTAIARAGLGYWTNARGGNRLGNELRTDINPDHLYPGTSSGWAYFGENIRCIAK